MKTLALYFVIAFVPNFSFAFWDAVKGAAEKAADIEMITDAVTDLSDSITDESELSNHLNQVREANSDVRNSLRDLNYTKDEINEILKGDSSSVEDIATSVSRTSRRIKRAKNLVKKIGILTMGSPDAVTASQTLEMNQTLREINTEMQHQRMDRQIEKDKARSVVLVRKAEQKKKEAFFKRQFALMENGSKTSSASFFPFKNTDESNRGADSLLNFWN